MELFVLSVLVVILLLLLASGLWIGLSVLGVGWAALAIFSERSIGDAMAISFWGSLSSWTLAPLPLFLWMGEILHRTKIAENMFNGLAPCVNRLPGRLLHVNTIGCLAFAAVSGSSAATCATIGKMSLPELARRGYPEEMAIGTLAGASTMGLMIPPSIIMIVYGVIANVSITSLFVAGVLPGVLLGTLFMGYTMLWATLNPAKVPPADVAAAQTAKKGAVRGLAPVAGLILLVLATIYAGIATATEAASLGVLGSLGIAAAHRSLTWRVFVQSLLSATRLYCVIALILGAAAFLTLAMGYLGLPRHLAEFISALELSRGALLASLFVLYLVLGCFLDGISMIVLTLGVLLPTIQASGIDLLWFGIFVIVIVEMAQITPPVGFNLFVIQGLTNWQISRIARAALPMFFLMMLAALLLYVFPEIVVWLPSQL